MTAPESAANLMDAGRAAFGQQNWTAAAELFGRVLELEPTNHLAASNRSGALAMLDKFDEALAAAKTCVGIQPTFAKGYSRVGAALQGLKRYEEAIAAYREAVRLEPSNALYSQAIAELDGLLKANQGIASDATRNRYNFERALAQGKQAMDAGHALEAVRHYTRALGLCDNAADRATLLCNRSAAHFNSGDCRESRADAEAAIECNPQYARAHSRLGLALLKVESLHNAKAAFERALQLDSDNKAAKEGLEKVLDEQRRQEEQRNAAVRVSSAPVGAQTAAKPPTAAAHARNALGANTQQSAPDAAISAAERASLRTVVGSKHVNGYSYCNACNQKGHTRANCPMLMSRKRER